METCQGDGDEAVSVSHYVEQLVVNLMQQPAHERGRRLQLELTELVQRPQGTTKASYKKPFLVDICNFLTLTVTGPNGTWVRKAEMVSNIMEKLLEQLLDTSAAAPAPAMGFPVALDCFDRLCFFLMWVCVWFRCCFSLLQVWT